ncbi:MAG: AAA family ATPase, partial [Cyanobacteriota bacterium]
DPTAPPAHRRTPQLPPLRLCGVGVSAGQLEEAARARHLPVEVVADPEQADAVLSVRGQLGQDPAIRRRAQSLGLPILVIKTDNPHQLQRAMERLVLRRAEECSSAQPPASPGQLQRLDDAHAAMEECRLAVEQVVLPQGRPVELLPRNERVRAMQAELVSRYRLRSAVFGQGEQQRLRVFPA